MKKIVFLIAIVLLCVQKVDAQAGSIYVNKDWQNNTGSPVFNPVLSQFGVQWSTSIKSLAGGLITVGHTNVSGQGENVFLTKMDADGNILFSIDYNTNSTNNDYGASVIEDGSGNIYVCGTTDNGGTTNYNIIILKYNSSGSLITSNTFAGSSNLNDIGTSILIHPNTNEIIVAGSSENSGTSYDYLALRLAPSNLSVLASNTYDYASLTDVPLGIEISSTGDVCLIGASASSIVNWDYAVAVFDPSTMNFISDTRNNIPGVGYDQPLAFCKDAAQNIYITGRASTDGINYNIRTIKILSNFSIAWSVVHDGFGLEDVGNTIAVDLNGDVVVGGFVTKANAIKDLKVLKYNGNTGAVIWQNSRPSTNISGDAFIKTIGLNPTTGSIYYLAGEKGINGQRQVAVGKIKSTGEQNWIKTINASTHDILPSDIKFATDGIYVISIFDPNGASYQTTKFAELVTDTTREYVNNSPFRLKKHLIVRFKQKALVPNKINNKELTFGTIKDFIDSVSLAGLVLSSKIKDIGTYKCYKVHPRMTMADSMSVTRSGRTVKIAPHYATFGVILPGVMADSTALFKILSALNIVDHAQYNRLIFLNANANDPEYTNGNSAGLVTNTVTPNANINIEPAWNLSTGDPNIKVGIFDSGINFEHLDFGNGTFAGSKIAGGYDYQGNVPLSTSTSNDIFGHGTAVADKIGALRNNNYGISGIAGGDGASNPGVTLYDMKIFGIGYACNFANTISASESETANAIIEGVVYNPSTGYGFGQHIQNHSWGGIALYGLILDSYITAFQNEVVMVAGSGNAAGANLPCYSLAYPASFRDNMVMKVGANNSSGGRTSFSQCGYRLDFIAPGMHDLYSSLSRTGTTVTDMLYWPPSPTNCYYDIDGTSFAAPHAAGTAALLLSYANNTTIPNGLYPEDIEELMQLSAKDLTVSPYSAGYDAETGHGRVDAGQTLNNFYFPGYIVKHHSFNVSASSAVQVGGTFENACLRTQMFGVPIGTGKVKRFKISGTNSHTIPTGYTLVKGWELGAGSNMMGVNSATGIAINCYTQGVAFEESNYLPDGTNIITVTITPTTASFEGYIYEIYDSNTNLPLGWYPFSPSETATFAYSLYLRSNTVGIKEELFTENSLYVYPNPTSDKIYFKSRLKDIDEINIEVISMLGQVVYKQNNLYIQDGNSIDVSHLSNGVYFANLKYGNKTIVKKIIVSK